MSGPAAYVIFVSHQTTAAVAVAASDSPSIQNMEGCYQETNHIYIITL